MIRLRQPWAVLLGLWIASTGAPSLAATLPEWARPPADLEQRAALRDADAVVIRDEWEFTCGPSGRRGVHRWAVLVRTTGGIDAAVLAVPSDEFVEYQKIKAWSVDRQGQVHTFDEEDGTLWSSDLTSYHFDLDRMLVLRAPRATAGTIFAISYEFRFSPTRPQDLFAVQRSIPVAEFRLSLRVEPPMQAHVRFGAGRSMEPEWVDRSAAYRLTDLPAVVSVHGEGAHEPPRLILAIDYEPSREQPVLGSWARVARWVLGLFEQAVESGEQVRAAALQATDPIEESKTAVRRLRYFANGLGWGGWIPRSPETVLRLGIGDCKDKAWLMHALLAGRGVESVAVLIAVPESIAVDVTLPSPFQFNHAVLGIPWQGREVTPDMTVVDSPGIGPLRLIDGTMSPGQPELSAALDGAVGLALDPRTTGILRVPTRALADNKLSSDCTATIYPRGAIEARCRRSHQGVTRDALFQRSGMRRSTEQLTGDLFREFQPSCGDFARISIDSEPAVDSDTLAFQLRCGQVLADFGEWKVLTLPSIDADRWFPVPASGEGALLYLRTPQVQAERWRFRLKGPQRLESNGFTVDNAVGTVRVSVEQGSGYVVVTRELVAKLRQITTKEHGDLRALREAVHRSNRFAIGLAAESEPLPTTPSEDQRAPDRGSAMLGSDRALTVPPPRSSSQRRTATLRSAKSAAGSLGTR